MTPGSHNGNRYRFAADGEFSDIDPRIKRLTCEFDAAEGPVAKLTGVVITYTRDGAAQGAVYSERATVLSKQYPLAPQSPAKMEASVPGTLVSRIDDAIFASVHGINRVR